jgi:hypothetical protein
MDVIFSHFQDKFATTHYTGIVGDNDSGKTSFGVTFVAIRYRPVYMTDPSAANIFRCFGSIEPGQCTIIIDEADKIDKSPEIMAILKTGAEHKEMSMQGLNLIPSSVRCERIIICLA